MTSSPDAPNGNDHAPNGNGQAVAREAEATEAPRVCTTAQLRRFIKSRPYVPLHELRRRFELNGEADEVHPVETGEGRVFLGLPAREAGMVGELIRQGEVGLEMSYDPPVPIVVGVYPIRPIPRP
ncbi:MAG TPA: hypothetical protein VFK38_00430 [Candidatus Limnocylindrales bacterium]|nr:hypothetical protein [Candidatus Limnocylindrales bacterium]